jgi:hypothetical protein
LEFRTRSYGDKQVKRRPIPKSFLTVDRFNGSSNFE